MTKPASPRKRPCNPQPPPSEKRYTVTIRCNHCGKSARWTEGNFPNQVEHFIMAHDDCKPPNHN